MKDCYYDIAIIGAGPGGYVAAIRAAQLGAKVVLIEQKKVGGVCLNKGCIPTKAIISSISLLEKIKEASNFGIDINGSFAPNLKKIIERKNKIVLNSIKGIEFLLKSNKVHTIIGEGKIISKDKITITNGNNITEIYSSNIIIATGSNPLYLKNFPIDGKFIITSNEALEETEIPKHVLIIGGGIIGCEWAFMYKSLGVKVSIVESLHRILAMMDEDTSKIIERELKKKKVDIYLNTKVTNIENKKAFLENGQALNIDKIFVSIGRKFNSENIGLEEIKVNMAENGQIIVNEYLETNIPNIYAIGDVIGGMMLAHKASYDGIVVVENIINKTRIKADYTYLPSVVFTQPEIASFGITEIEAKEKKLDYKIGNFPFRASSKAMVMGETNGFVKIITSKEDNKIIGASIAGPSATEIIHELALAAQNNLPIDSIIKTIHGHPTLSESIKEAAEDVLGKAIHFKNKN